MNIPSWLRHGGKLGRPNIDITPLGRFETQICTVLNCCSRTSRFFTNHVDHHTNLPVISGTHCTPHCPPSISFMVDLNVLKCSIDFSHFDRISGTRTMATYFACIQPGRVIQPTLACSLHYLCFFWPRYCGYSPWEGP